MRYTKYLALVATLSILSVSTLASAATGAIVPLANTTLSSTGMMAPASLEVKGAPRLVKKTSNSITLEWDAVSTATAYIVKYSKTSVANSKDPTAQYDNETDQLTTTGVVITKLSSNNEALAPATTYYFSFVAIDKDMKESDTFSDELMVVTDAAGMVATGSTTALAIQDLTVIDTNTISLAFNAALSTEPVNVKITKTSDNSDVLVGTVTQDLVNPNTVKITTLAALSPISSYTLTVLSAKDAAGNTIKEGVSGLKEFTTPETLKSTTGTEVPVLNAAGTESGTTLSGAMVDVTAATKVATGAQANIMILAALLLSLGIVYIYRRKLV
ncbi:MAG: fibronectin type III domain-containing protein [Candidatus Gracilibacteria bacterium]